MKSPTKMIAVFAFFLRTFCSILHVSFSAKTGKVFKCPNLNMN